MPKFQTGSWTYEIINDESYSQHITALVTSMASDPDIPPIVVKPTISKKDLGSSEPLVVNAKVKIYNYIISGWQ